MAEYIDRAEYCEKHCRCSKEFCTKESCPIWKAPAADVAPVVHGVWACVNKIDPISGYRCSKCRRIVGFDLTPYCPNCGAKMDGGDNDAID